MKSIYEHNEIIHNNIAASKILPFILKDYQINSVLDIGTGIGTWLEVIQKHGIDDYIGVDGDWVKEEMLKIPKNKFISHNLSLPLNLNRKFDLTICLEVAEHLPESSADTLVESIVRHSNIIIFSAAIPGQGGQNHLNEQPPSYWSNKFNKHGYVLYDIIRPRIWQDNDIEWWYRQNIFVVTKPSIYKLTSDSIPNMYIHPVLFNNSLKKLEKINKKYESIINGEKSIFFYFKLFVKSIFRK